MLKTAEIIIIGFNFFVLSPPYSFFAGAAPDGQGRLSQCEHFSDKEERRGSIFRDFVRITSEKF